MYLFLQEFGKRFFLLFEPSIRLFQYIREINLSSNNRNMSNSLYHLHKKYMGDTWRRPISYIKYLTDTFEFGDQELAIAIDIDGTIFSDHAYHIGEIFPNAVETIKALSQYATLYIITARSENIRIETVGELREADILDSFAEIFMRPVEMKDIIKFKVDTRELIRNRGFHIVMSIGDNACDLTYADNSSHEETDLPCMNILTENPFLFE